VRDLALAELSTNSLDFDRAVAASGAHAHFSSSFAWVGPAHDVFAPDRMPWMWRV